MSPEDLAAYANVTLYSAMAVLTLSMIAYAVYLAAAVRGRERATEPARMLVAPGAPGGGRPLDGPPVDGPPVAFESHRVRKAGGVAQSFALLATLLVAVSVVLRGLSVERPPLGNMFEFAVAACLGILAAFSIWATRLDLRWLGLFVVTPVLLTLGMALTVWYTEAAELLPSLKSYWLVIHVSVAILSVAVCALAAIVTILYLLADRAESTGGASRLSGLLPAPQALERLGYAMHIVAFPLWTFTLIAGAIWARQAWASYWNWDPKEVWTFVIWVVYAGYLHARATTGISRQRASYIALAGFACVVLNFAVVNVFFVGQHSYSGL